MDAVEWWGERQPTSKPSWQLPRRAPRGGSRGLVEMHGVLGLPDGVLRRKQPRDGGEELMQRGREMAWLRLERYWLTDAAGKPQGAVNSPDDVPAVAAAPRASRCARCTRPTTPPTD